MTDLFVRNWWAFVLRGIVAIIFGVLALIVPGITLTFLVYLFGAYALIDGIFAVIGAVRAAETGRDWIATLLEGLAGIAIGVITFIWPGITALVLLYLIAAWALVTGVIEVIAAVRLRHYIANEWLLGLSGVLSIIFGVILFLFPGAGALSLIWLIGIYAILFGIVMIALGVRLHGMHEDREPTPV